MSQGKIYRTRDGADLLCRVQSDLGYDTPFILFAPVVPRSDVNNLIQKLYIPCTVAEVPHLILMTQMIALPSRDVGGTVGDASDKRDDIIAAVDLLVSGF